MEKNLLSIVLTLSFALEGTAPLIRLRYLDTKMVLVPVQMCSPRLLERNLLFKAGGRFIRVPSWRGSFTFLRSRTVRRKFRKLGKEQQHCRDRSDALLGQRGLFGDEINQSFPQCQQLPLPSGNFQVCLRSDLEKLPKLWALTNTSEIFALRK